MKYEKILCAVFALVSAAGAASAYDPLGLNLPNSTVRMYVTGLASDSAMVYITLENVPEGYDVSNGVYLGWCANPNKPLIYSQTDNPYYYQTRLYSSYDTALPEKVQSPNWKKINYLVNTYRKGGFTGVCRNPVRDDEIQTMIWRYLGYDKSFGMPSEICIMILDGLVNESNGAEFVPSSGDYVGVVCDNGDDYQVTFIEIPYVAAALSWRLLRWLWPL